MPSLQNFLVYKWNGNLTSLNNSQSSSAYNFKEVFLIYFLFKKKPSSILEKNSKRALYTCTYIYHIKHLNKHTMFSRVKNLNPGDDNANTFCSIIKSIYTTAVCMTKTQLYVVALLCRHVKVMTLNPGFPATSL